LDLFFLFFLFLLWKHFGVVFLGQFFLRVSCFGPWSWSNKEEQEEEEEEEEEKDDDDHKKKRSHTPHTHIVFLIRGETLTLSSVCF